MGVRPTAVVVVWLSAMLLTGCGQASAPSGAGRTTTGGGQHASAGASHQAPAEKTFAGVISPPGPLCEQSLKPILGSSLSRIPGSEAPFTIAEKDTSLDPGPQSCVVMANLPDVGSSADATFSITAIDKDRNATLVDPIVLSFDASIKQMRDALKNSGVSLDDPRLTWPKRLTPSGWTYGETNFVADAPTKAPDGSTPYGEDDLVLLTPGQVMRCSFRAPVSHYPGTDAVVQACNGVRDVLFRG